MKLKLINPTPEYLGNKIRVLVDEEMNNAPWFVAVDVTKTLGLSGSAVRHTGKLFDTEQRTVNRIDCGMRGGSAVVVVSESGFYKLVMRSNKKQAEAFQHWVCAEVLPSIRKYGQYVAYADVNDNPINVPDVMVEMVKLSERLPTGNGTTETAPRLKVCEYVLAKEIDGLGQYARAALGKIARRLLHTHGLPVLKQWRPLKHLGIRGLSSGNVGTYPEAILDMAYDEYIRGMRD